MNRAPFTGGCERRESAGVAMLIASRHATASADAQRPPNDAVSVSLGASAWVGLDGGRELQLVRGAERLAYAGEGLGAALVGAEALR